MAYIDDQTMRQLKTETDSLSSLVDEFEQTEPQPKRGWLSFTRKSRPGLTDDWTKLANVPDLNKLKTLKKKANALKKIVDGIAQSTNATEKSSGWNLFTRKNHVQVAHPVHPDDDEIPVAYSADHDVKGAPIAHPAHHEKDFPVEGVNEFIQDHERLAAAQQAELNKINHRRPTVYEFGGKRRRIKTRRR